MRSIFLFAVFFFISVPEYITQNYYKIDSLHALLKNSSSDTSKINIYNQIANNYISSFDTALLFSDTAILISNKLKNRLKICESHYVKGKIYRRHNIIDKALSNYFIALRISEELKIANKQSDYSFDIGNIYKDQGNHEKAIQFYKKVISIETNNGNKKSLASAINNIGLVYWMSDSYELALNNFLESLKIKDEIGDKAGVAGAYTNIGVIYYVIGNRKKAIEYWELSLSRWQDLKDKTGMVEALNNLGAVYSEDKMFDKSLEYLFKSLNLKEELGDERSLATTCSNIGEVYILKKEYSKAETFFNRAEKIYLEKKDVDGLIASYTSFASLFNETKNFTKSKEYIEKAIELAKSTGSLSRQKNAYGIASEIYESSQEFKISLDYYKTFYAITDSLNKKNRESNIIEIQTKFDTEKKEKEIELLNKEKELKERLLIEGRIVRNVSILGIIVALIIVYILFNRYRLKKKITDQLTHRNIVIEQQKEELIAQKELLSSTNDNLTKTNSLLTDSINYAKKIQDAMFPSDEYMRNIFVDFFVLLKPKSIVSGDFYWVYSNNNKSYIAVADCTGHGVPGAFMSMIGNTLLNEIIIENSLEEPADILEKLNERIIQLLIKKEDISNQNNDGMEISICVIDKNQSNVKIASANQNVFYIVDDKFNIYEGDHFSIGGTVFRNSGFKYKSIEINYSPNNTYIYMMSDGFQDQFGGESNTKFMSHNIKALIKDLYKKDFLTQKEIFESDYIKWKGKNKQIDDILIFGFKI